MCIYIIPHLFLHSVIISFYFNIVNIHNIPEAHNTFGKVSRANVFVCIVF